jgi:hypothetical protein
MNFHHVYCEYDRKDPDAIRRYEFAKATWGSQWLIPRPVHEDTLSRSSLDIGDTRKLPFVRDLIDAGAGGLPPEDVIILTNDDTCFAFDTVDRVMGAMTNATGCFAHRWDVPTLTRPLDPSEFRNGAGMYPGFDLFAFTPQWWSENRERFPDLIIGCQWWDCILWLMLQRSGALELSDLIYHEQHAAIWCQPPFLTDNPGQVYVRGLAQEWFEKNPGDEMKFEDGEWSVR